MSAEEFLEYTARNEQKNQQAMYRNADLEINGEDSSLTDNLDIPLGGLGAKGMRGIAI